MRRGRHRIRHGRSLTYCPGQCLLGTYTAHCSIPTKEYNMTMETSTLIRSRDEGEATWFFNALVTTKAAMHETAGAYSLTEHLVTAASNPPMHVQSDEDEAFYILEGEIEFEVDGQVVVASPGMFA